MIDYEEVERVEHLIRYADEISTTINKYLRDKGIFRGVDEKIARVENLESRAVVLTFEEKERVVLTYDEIGAPSHDSETVIENKALFYDAIDRAVMNLKHNSRFISIMNNNTSSTEVCWRP